MEYNLTKKLRCGLLNAQSVSKKTFSIREKIIESSLDILAITETWLSERDHAKIGEMLPSTHTFLHVPRQDDERGGGVGIFLSKQFTNIKMIPRQPFNSFEYLEVNFYYNNNFFKFIIIYRPPSSSKPVFLEDYSKLTESIDCPFHSLFICGDFNLWMDDNNDPYVKRFKENLDIFNLANMVTIPTSRGGHILDLILNETPDGLVSNVEVETDFSMSDHKFIFFALNIPRKDRQVKRISFRMKRDFEPYLLIQNCIVSMREKSLEQCQCETRNPETFTTKDECLQCFTTMYREVFFSEYDHMCPVVEKNIIERDFSPWFNSGISEARKKRRAAERRWRRLHTAESRTYYVSLRNEVVRLIRNSKISYFKKKIEEAGTDMSKLYSFFNQLLGKVNQKSLPEGYSPIELVEKFSLHFETKIENIYNSFDNVGAATNSFLPDFPFAKFSTFKNVSFSCLKEIIIKAKKTYCESDPFPFSDVMSASNLDEVLHIYHKIIMLSLTEGFFPNSEKMALIKPSLKGKLDHQIFNSYRPISNLSFLSKIIEQVVLSQLNEHLSRIGILSDHQSAYRKNYSTETALCAVVNDLLINMDDGKCSVLVLLDLSAAFDTVVHDFLINDLIAIGLDEFVLQWFGTYLSGRQFSVVVGNSKSPPRPLARGVPQGSVLGPVLFSIYTIELSFVLQAHGVRFKFFADDTQFYFAISDIPNSQRIFSEIMMDVKRWMDSKRLKLNELKTECIPIGTRFSLREIVELQGFQINDSFIAFSESAKNLGVVIDQSLTFKDHILATVKATNYHLKNIAFIKKYLDEKSLKLLVNNFVITRLDYCNSLYFNLPNYLLRKLQAVFNRAARLITGQPFWNRVTPLLIDLHWLPIRARIVFKICVLTYQVLNTGVPDYLRQMLKGFEIASAIRLRNSDDEFRLLEPRATKHIGTRAFTHSAPRLYNSLPHEVKNSDNVNIFKKRLKTHLFMQCYDLEDKKITDRYKI